MPREVEPNNDNLNSNMTDDAYSVGDVDEEENHSRHKHVAEMTADISNERKRSFRTLSEEDRRQRRLESNRRSADKSRKRKKRIAETLQISVTSLTRENDMLLKENDILRNTLMNLTREASNSKRENETLRRNVLMGNTNSLSLQNQAYNPFLGGLVGNIFSNGIFPERPSFEDISPRVIRAMPGAMQISHSNLSRSSIPDMLTTLSPLTETPGCSLPCTKISETTDDDDTQTCIIKK